MSDNITMSVKDTKGTELVVDDIVKGASNNYGITNYAMTRGRVLEIDDDEIRVRVLSHTSANAIGDTYWVKAKYFEKVGHIKPFVREEFLENLAKGEVNYNEYDLYGADLRSADLSGANLRSADLSEVRYDECTAFFAMVCPEEGSFIAWKVCSRGLVVKLKVTEDAKRSSATSRKCRCSKAEVLAIEDKKGNSMPEGTIAYSQRDSSFTYEVGKTVEVTDFDEDRWRECSTGIHFFITRREAVLYYC